MILYSKSFWNWTVELIHCTFQSVCKGNTFYLELCFLPQDCRGCQYILRQHSSCLHNPQLMCTIFKVPWSFYSTFLIHSNKFDLWYTENPFRVGWAFRSVYCRRFLICNGLILGRFPTKSCKFWAYVVFLYSTTELLNLVDLQARIRFKIFSFTQARRLLWKSMISFQATPTLARFFIGNREKKGTLIHYK